MSYQCCVTLYLCAALYINFNNLRKGV